MWTVLLLAAGCGAPPVPPSDEEMTQHFLAHEAAFETLREVIARCPYGMYYPPYDTQDTACLKGISTEDRHRLDSLLAAIGGERVFYYGKEAKKEAMKMCVWSLLSGQMTGIHTSGFQADFYPEIRRCIWRPGTIFHLYMKRENTSRKCTGLFLWQQ